MSIQRQFVMAIKTVPTVTMRTIAVSHFHFLLTNSRHLMNKLNIPCIDYFQCKEPTWRLCKDNATCILESLWCDGHYDCPGREDETACADYVPHYVATSCSDAEYTCVLDRLCVPLENVCDGVQHCIDNSDETIGCKTIEQRCKGFLCKNKHCLTDPKWVCDGHNDCGDNSDEVDCCKCAADAVKRKKVMTYCFSELFSIRMYGRHTEVSMQIDGKMYRCQRRLQ